jgi:hypothetical protein
MNHSPHLSAVSLADDPNALNALIDQTNQINEIVALNALNALNAPNDNEEKESYNFMSPITGVRTGCESNERYG